MNEVLGRLVRAPTHLRGKAADLHISVVTHSEGMGMSVIREAHANDDDVIRLADRLFPLEKRKSDKKFGIAGVVLFSAQLVKDFPPDELEAAFCLYDTANDILNAHADVFQRVADAAENLIARRRVWLFEKVKSGFVRADSYRAGLLADYQPGAA